MKNDVMVSIVCNTFNHENYIADALDSFLMQKTEFHYEILIHDDASTDNTAAIIRKYEEKYPDIIKPIYQKVNQYSLKTPIGPTYQIPRARGKYIAYCEGDDYWIDCFKLQKQVNALESQPEIDICTHAATEVDADTKKIKSKIMPFKQNCIIPLKKVILGGGGFVATNSIMIRRECIAVEYDFRKELRLDYTLQLQGTVRGGMLYLSDNMSAYRSLSQGSWSSKMTRNINALVGHLKRIEKMLNVFNEETGYKYNSFVQKKIRTIQYDCFKIEKNYREILKHYKTIFILEFLLRIKRYFIRKFN